MAKLQELGEKIVDKFIETVTSGKFHAFLSVVLLTLSHDDVPGLLAVSDATLDRLMAETMVYLGVKGFEDHGKGKARVEAAETKKLLSDTAKPDEPV